MSGDVLTFVEGRVGRIRLNRPNALHALNEAMCATMIDALVAWTRDPAVALVVIDHAEGRGFCAGGDVRAVAESGRGDGVAARSFFFTEYRLNHLLFTYSKPVVAVMDGVVMGGGVGIALPARIRIATERTLFAMPEATIGLFPDVGGGWHLSRLPGRLGQWLALTAARLNGAETKAVGIATHYLPSDRIEDVKAALIADPQGAEAALDAASAVSPDSALPLDEIDRLFAADTLEAILAALEAHGGACAAETRATIATKSPTSCKVALRLLREAAGRTDFADEMRAEYRVAVRMSAGHDFIEGVRALLVDRDNAPRWTPATADGVTDAMVDAIFAPLPPDEEWTPLVGNGEGTSWPITRPS